MEEMVAMVGPEGTGKTRFLLLVVEEVEVEEQAVTVEQEASSC